MPKAANTRAAWDISSREPTRMAPWRSAVTRWMLPSRSACSPAASMQSWFTSSETSTSVV